MLYNFQINIIAKDLSEKYFEPFKEIRKEISDFLLNYAHEIKVHADSIGIALFDAEQSVVYYYFKNKYEL